MENLRHLMAAYFHQDWWEEYDGSWVGAVDDYARRAPERVPCLLTEIDALLAAVPDEPTLGRTLTELGNYRSVGESPTAYRDWLRDIRAHLSSAS